jgi:hypothetical protein
MHVRRKRTRKALVSDTALSVSEVQAMGGYEEVEAEIREEMLRSKKRTYESSFNIDAYVRTLHSSYEAASIEYAIQKLKRT